MLRTAILVASLLCAGVVLVACGPERSSGGDRLDEEAVRIAREFGNDGDVNRARAQLQTLDVANPVQWLVYLAETAVTEGEVSADTDALVQLTVALGLPSGPVLAYAREHNLIEEPTPVPAAQVQAQSVVAPTATLQQVVVVAASPTALAVAEATAEPAPPSTETPVPNPQVSASKPMNVRGGPSTAYPVVGALDTGTPADITGKNQQADWWQILLPTGQKGWVYAPLVETAGSTAAIGVVTDIPAAPPSATPAPAVAEAPAPAPLEPAAESAPEQAPPADGKPYFRVISSRLWNKPENDGCAGKHLLRIHVIDANGVRLNGVALQGIYTGEILVTGSQGKGDGIIEYDLYGSGEGFVVIRDADGREVESERAEGYTTRSVDIDEETLIGAGYCTNSTDCAVFYKSYGCHGHHSWEATFQRNY